MASRPTECDRNRLRLSLEDQLSDAEQAELADHVEWCAACRQRLEQMAATSKFWGDAVLLRGEHRLRAFRPRPPSYPEGNHGA